MPPKKDSKPPRFEVDRIYFSLKLFKALIPIKFKCRFFVEIKTFSTTSPINILSKSKDHYRSLNGNIVFDNDQLLEFDTFMVYDNQHNTYKKKQVQLIVNLISDNRGDQTKLVGRIKIDLANFMIENAAETIHKQQQLQNCSVKKPQVAKIQYQLKLVREDKLKIQTHPDKEIIFSQIKEGHAFQALDYNQFYKEVFESDDKGKLNISGVASKSNKSIVQNGQTQKSASKQIPPLKISSKQKNQNPSSQQKTKPESIQKEKYKPVLGSGKKISINVEKEQKQSIYQSVTSNSQGSSIKKIVSPKSIKNIPVRQPRVSPPKRSILQSSTKSIPRSPQSSMIQRHQGTMPQNQQHQQGQQQQVNYLTQSMYEEQELVIQSLQQEVKQCNQIIQQYKLQFDLMKEQAEKLQFERESHLLQIDLKNQEIQKFKKQNQQLNSKISQNAETFGTKVDNTINTMSISNDNNNSQQQLQQLHKVIVEKQEIIVSKSRLIEQLEQDLQNSINLFQQKLSEKDLIHQQALHENNKLKQTIEQLSAKISKKDQQNQQFTWMIEQLKKSIEQLDLKIKSSNTPELLSKISQKDSIIKQLQSNIELQKTINVQNQLRIDTLEQSAKQYNAKIASLAKDLLKKQQISSKSVLAKQKAEQEAAKAIQKSKVIEKEKYFLTQQITALNLQGKSMSRMVDQKLQAYVNQISEMERAYEQSQNKIAELKFAVQSYQSTLQQQQMKNLYQVDQLTKKLQNFNKKEHLLRQSLDLLQNQTNKIRVYVAEKEITIKQYEQILILKQEQMASKDDKISYLQRKYKMAQNAVEDLKIQVKVMQAMSPSRQSIKSGDCDYQEQLESRLFIVNQANSQLLQKQKIQSEEIDKKSELIRSLEKQLSTIDSKNRQINSLEQKVSLFDKKNNELKEQLRKLTQTIMDQKTKLQQQQEQLQHVYSQCEKFQEQIKVMQEQKFVLFAQSAEKQLQVNRLMSGEERLKQQFRQHAKQKKQMQRLMIEHQKNANELIKKISKLQKQKEKLHSQNSQQPLRLTNIISQIKPKPEEQSKTNVLSKNSSCRSNNNRSKQQQEVYVLREELEGYKHRQQQYMCNVLDLQMQLDKVKEQKVNLSTSMNQHHGKHPIRKNNSNINNKSGISVMTQPQRKQLKLACDQLQKLIEQRIKTKDTQSLLQFMITKSEILESRITSEEGENLISNQKNLLQQKSRILSRQVQKIKSLILKKHEISYKDKSQIIQYLKPCQNITNELIKVIQNFTKDNDDENNLLGE